MKTIKIVKRAIDNSFAFFKKGKNYTAYYLVFIIFNIIYIMRSIGIGSIQADLDGSDGFGNAKDNMRSINAGCLAADYDVM